MFYFVNFYLGACLASFMAVITDRYPNQNFIWGRSYCFNCQHQLAWRDELPIFSFLLLKGRCRFCQQLIPKTLLIVEICGGLVLSRLNFFDISAWVEILFLASLLLLSLMDIKQHYFDTIWLSPILLALIFRRISVTFFDWQDCLQLVPIVGAMVISIILGKFGQGDLLIYLAIALFYHPARANFSLLLGCLLCIIWAYWKKPKGELPFLPFITSGLVLALFFS